MIFLPILCEYARDSRPLAPANIRAMVFALNINPPPLTEVTFWSHSISISGIQIWYWLANRMQQWPRGAILKPNLYRINLRILNCMNFTGQCALRHIMLSILAPQNLQFIWFSLLMYPLILDKLWLFVVDVSLSK